jgi:hypothetical protein
VPATGALFGAFVDPNNHWGGNAEAKQEVTAFEASIGRKLAINHHYYGWTDVFPSGLEEWDLSMGRIPLISWQGTALDSILNGSQDALIGQRADDVKGLHRQVFLRWGWEMNGDWFDWSGAANNDPGLTNGPAKYVAAWRHIHDIFRARGTTDAVWVWCPNNQNVPKAPWNRRTSYYPGDDYVDWIAFDGYNWGTTQSWSSWRGFRPLFRIPYTTFAPRKPIMIAETSSAEQGGDKAAWIQQAGAAVKAKFPGIAAFVWFHVPKEADWRADSSPAAMAAFRALGADPYFSP